MGIETVLFKSKEKKSAADVAQTLRLIADKIDSGAMTLQQGETQVDLEFPGTMKLEMKVEEEQGRNRLKKSFEIELEWTPGEETSPTGASIL
ncbi:MAG: amphi-Trp domain-containing protein [Desulfobacterales bacterium]|nr:amphi-Trp domain-containing protein [Desulfobacterales bacterium]